ncbi:MAG TPA: hypothetical protein VMH79_07740 [Thermoanaerobaculia bacterium]|nr:hypothetical protein [Thermoanaerobaculia bacterium]
MSSRRFRIAPGVLVSFALAAAAAAQSTAPVPAAPAPTPAATPKPAPSPEALKEGKALFARFVQSYGGSENVRKVHDVWTRGLVTAKTPQGDMSMDVQTAMVFPDKISQQVDAPFGRMAMVATPTGAFIVGPNAVQDLPPGMKEELLRQVRRVPLLLAQKADDPRLVVAAAGTEKIGDLETRVLDLTYDGASVRWYLDPATFHIVRSAHTSSGPQGDARIVSDYSEYKTVDGFPVAYHLEVATNGEKDQVLALEECKFNPGVEAKLFEKPVFPTPVPTAAPTHAAPPAPTAAPTPK